MNTNTVAFRDAVLGILNSILRETEYIETQEKTTAEKNIQLQSKVRAAIKTIENGYLVL